MNKEKLRPELRFPEFQNQREWELTSIGEIGNFYYGKSAPKWSLSEDAPTLCVRYGELYTKFDTIITEIKSRTNIEPSDLKFSKGGEILVPRVGERATDFAKNCCYLPYPNIAIGEMISVFETKEFPLFYTHYFRTLWREFAEVVEGQNVKNLYYINLEPIKIGKPSKEEQQKIASCLSSLDEVIAAHNQKLELLKDHKKGLMQNLFPQLGKKVPKFRFKEFEKDGEWVEKRIDDIGNIVASGDLDADSFSSKPTDLHIYPIYSNSVSNEGLYGYNTYSKFKPISVTITARGTLGVAFVRKTEFVGIGRLLVISDLNDNDAIFLKENWNHYAKVPLENGGIPQLTAAKAKSITLLFPKPKEQKKIASCFSTLDALINAQAEKIEQLKLHKKGLMQGLFPKMND